MASWQRGSWIWFLLAVMMYPAVALAEQKLVSECNAPVEETLVFTIVDGPALAHVTINYRLLDDDALSLVVESAGSCRDQSVAPDLFTPNRGILDLG